MTDKDWVPLFALPSRDYGSVSVQKMIDVTRALGMDPGDTEISSTVDDVNDLWYVVLVPPDATSTRMSLEKALAVVTEEAEARRAALAKKASDPTPERQQAPEIKDESGEEHPGQEWELPPSRDCRKCGRVFDTKLSAGVHEEMDHAAPSRVACENCGWVFTSTRSVRHHQTLMHAPPADAPPGNEDPPRSERKLACGEPACGFSADYAVDLNTHTVGAHGRRATREERTPRQPSTTKETQ